MKRIIFMFTAVMAMSLPAHAEKMRLTSPSLVGLYLKCGAKAQVDVQTSESGRIRIASFTDLNFEDEAKVVSDDRVHGGELVLQVGEAQLIVGMTDFTKAKRVRYALIFKGQRMELEPFVELTAL